MEEPMTNTPVLDEQTIADIVQPDPLPEETIELQRMSEERETLLDLLLLEYQDARTRAERLELTLAGFGVEVPLPLNRRRG